MNKKPYLSVIIPAYNEQDNLERGALSVVINYLSQQKYTWELLLVNDGSSDSTLQILKEVASKNNSIRVINNQHMGKQATVITRALASVGEIILFSDMDQATPISEFEKFLPKFKAGFDIVIGSRSGRPNAPLFRQILAYGNVILRSLILRLPVKDSQCGFKAFTFASANKIFTIMNKVHPPVVVMGPSVDPGFDMEMLFLGRKLGYKISEVPVTWRHQESRRVSFIKDALAGIKGLLLIRLRSITNSYGL
jgi:glycosyltransferase involved in cell wall biosynthesis